MKTMGIIGIIISSIYIMIALGMIGEEGMWTILLAFGFFLAMSITVLRSK